MRFEYFIASRLFLKQKSKGRKTGPAVKIAVTGIALGLAVMLVAIGVVQGFKHEIRDKVIGVGAHIQIASYYSNYSYEMSPLNVPDTLLGQLRAIPGVRHVQPQYTKPGMIKTKDDFQVVVFKGVDSCFDASFLKSSLVAGTFPDYSQPSNDVLISEYLSDLLHLKPGDAFLAYFIRDEAQSARRFKVSGVYNTHFTSYDKAFLLTDARHIRQLNDWESDQAGGIEVFFESMKAFDATQESVYQTMSRYASDTDEVYYMRNLYELNPDLFGWLDLLDMNVLLILLLMIFVSGFNIISGLLILILERTNFIGVLKALGAGNRQVRRIFVSYSTYLVAIGLLWGNVIGLGICFLQKYAHVLKLDPSVYYVDAVPIELNVWWIVLVNVGTILVSMAVVLVPSHLITHIHPAKAIRFE